MFYVTCNDISVIYVTAYRGSDGLKRSCSYGRAPNAIDISQVSLTCSSYTDTGPPFIYGDYDTPPDLVVFFDTLGILKTYSRLKPPASSRGRCKVNVVDVLKDHDCLTDCMITQWGNTKNKNAKFSLQTIPFLQLHQTFFYDT